MQYVSVCMFHIHLNRLRIVCHRITHDPSRSCIIPSHQISSYSKWNRINNRWKQLKTYKTSHFLHTAIQQIQRNHQALGCSTGSRWTGLGGAKQKYFLLRVEGGFLKLRGGNGFLLRGIFWHWGVELFLVEGDFSHEGGGGEWFFVEDGFFLFLVEFFFSH